MTIDFIVNTIHYIYNIHIAMSVYNIIHMNKKGE